MSGRHAEVWCDGGGAWVVDLGSTNGTALNGRPVGGRPCPVRPGDRLQLGDVVLMIGGPHAAPGVRDDGPHAGRGIGIGSQHGTIANAEGDIHLDRRVTQHQYGDVHSHNVSGSYNRHYQNNNYEVDVNPLPRAPVGRYLIYAGLIMKTAGILMCLYWVLQYLRMVFGLLSNPPELDPGAGGFEGFDIPPIDPWIPAGTVLFVIGSTLSIVGLVVVYSTRKKAKAHEYR